MVAISPMSNSSAKRRPGPAVMYRPSVDPNHTFGSKNSGSSPSLARE